MNPYLQMAYMQQQGEQQSPQEVGMPSPQQPPPEEMEPTEAPPTEDELPEESPISRGAIKGMQLAKQMLGMNENEDRRALGAALMRFGSNMARPGYGPGLAGALGAVNASFGAGADAYNAERDRINEQNFLAMKMAMEAEKQRRAEAFKMQQLDEMRRHRESQLAETQRHHSMMEPYYSSMAAKNRAGLLDEIKKEKLQELYPGSVPYSGLTAPEKTNFTKELNQRASAPRVIGKSLRTLDKMLKISEDHPDLSTSLTAWLGGNTVPSRWLMNKRDRIANEKMNTLAKQLAIQKMEEGVGGARIGVFLEKVIEASKAHGGMTPETIQYIRDRAKEEYDSALEDSKLARKALAGEPGLGRFYIPRIEEPYEDGRRQRSAEEQEQQNANGYEENNQTYSAGNADMPDFSSLSDEELMRMANE